ncbi:Mercuric ion reductase [hydrothermal vent metagenome]|uniref:Mercuric ion reductase n=1 Tax=hydrothermal vent metagenome TaxID=652676 RepID=A0A3B1AZH6_9ZZZZ
MTTALYPDDKYNQELVEKLHPGHWKNPAPLERYNLVVIGAGPAGLVAAAGAAGLGAKVALIERHLLGGDCLNFGCVPSKALLSAAHSIYEARRSAKFGFTFEGAGTLDFAKVMAGLRKKRNDMAHHDSVERFTALGIDVFLGDGQFISPSCAEVSGKKLNFHRAVIATGARASLPPISGLAEASPLTNETLFSLTELPKRLIIIGAGPIGCEMAQSFCRFGSEVTLIEMADRIMPTEDADASAVLTKQLEQEGVNILINAKVTQAENSGSHKAVTVNGNTIEADEILVAAGRIPNIEGLNLGAAGVEYHGRGVTVNDRLQTTSSKIYAAGDICSAFQFTHSADSMAKIVLQNALFFGRKKVSDLVMPWATYTSPEVAHVGMTAVEAAEQGDKIITLTAQMSDVDRAILEEETDGFARVHVDKKTGRILGATMVSSHAGESITQMALAITSGLKISAIGATIHPYPIQADVWKKLANNYLKRSFTPKIAKIFKVFLTLFSRHKRLAP